MYASLHLIYIYYLLFIIHICFASIFPQELGHVLLATGGFAGDTGPASLMAKWAPQLLQVPTTSDERTNGDGIGLSGAVKAATQRLGARAVRPWKGRFLGWG